MNNVIRDRRATQGVETIHARCKICQATMAVPDKGWGRARLSAWETQHQHPGQGAR